jgi:acetyltransferase-like isoleucine patch superfamily enzyme
MRFLLRIFLLRILSISALVATFGFVNPALSQTTTGTWTLDPPQAQALQVSIDQPINPDGSSVFSAKAVVPIQYDLLSGYGPVVFESLLAASQQNPYVPPAFSALDFVPSNITAFSQITNLSAEYGFTTGTCHGGALRWSIGFSDGSTIFIYYGKDSGFWNDCSSNTSDPTIDQSGLNMIGAHFDGGATGTDVRYETSDHPGTYTTYNNALSCAVSKTLTNIVLVLDAGWGGNQILNLGHVTVNDNTFIPQSANFTSSCPAQPAQIQVSSIGSSNNLTVDESVANVGPDTGLQFRMVDCKYKYNLAGKALGPGHYQVDVLVNNAPLLQTGIGTRFYLK